MEFMGEKNAVRSMQEDAGYEYRKNRRKRADDDCRNYLKKEVHIVPKMESAVFS